MNKTVTGLEFANRPSANAALAEINSLMGYPNEYATTYDTVKPAGGGLFFIEIDERRSRDLLVNAHGPGLRNHPAWIRADQDMDTSAVVLANRKNRAQVDAENNSPP